MPTGYTSKVADGTLTDFTEYAKKCASAFIGDKLEKDKKYVAEDYHETEMQKARQELDEFLRLSDDGKYQMYISEQEQKRKFAEESIKESDEVKARYLAMLEKAKAFKAPSPKHEDFAKFLVQQLEDSISRDCDTDYYEDLLEAQPFDEWREGKLRKLLWEADYHTREYTKVVKRAEETNKWASQLREALGL
jgi:hypothetical protein